MRSDLTNERVDFILNETSSQGSSSNDQNLVEICMNMIITVLEEGLLIRKKVRDEVKSRISKTDPSICERKRAFPTRWDRALRILREQGKISEVPSSIHLIKKPEEDQVRIILDRLKTLDNSDIVEIGLRQLWQLSENEHISIYPQILEAIELIITEKKIINPKMLSYLLPTCDNILKHNYDIKPEKYENINRKTDMLLGLFYLGINCDRTFDIIETAIDLLPKYASNVRIVSSLIDLIKCLDDASYEKLRFRFRWRLFDHQYRIAQLHFEYIDSELIKLALESEDRIKNRAKHLLSHKIEGMQGR